MPRYEWNENYQSMQLVKGSENYRSKWACFRCRKSFTYSKPQEVKTEVKCPKCKKAALDMGYLFEAPPSNDARQWRIMELLGKNGFTFDSTGNVIFIHYRITGKKKASPTEVKKNIDTLLNDRCKYVIRKRKK